jgi:hypothetical protein
MDIKMDNKIDEIARELRTVKTQVSVRDTTNAVIDAILKSSKLPETFQQMFAACNSESVDKLWVQIKDTRRQMSIASSEEVVQVLMMEIAETCCKGGPLAAHDTHVQNYLGKHKIDICLTNSNFKPGKPVLMGVVTAFGEFKCDFDKRSLDDAAVQINDRVCAIVESQGERIIICFIADKAQIQVFKYEAQASPGPFISTNMMPFINLDKEPTPGFRLFYMMCQSTPDQLGYPHVPNCPIGERACILRLRAPPKASVFRVLKDGQHLVVKAYNMASSQHIFKREMQALLEFKTAKAPVAELVGRDEGLGYLLLKPYAKTLKDCAEFKLELLFALTGAGAEFFGAAQALNLVHKDISPDNILVRSDNQILFNDLGSCHELKPVYSLDGANPMYCCPFFGTAVQRNCGPYMYTTSNDLRAFFISLFSFAMLPKCHGKLHWALPWEHDKDIQKSKFVFLMDLELWKRVVQPDAQQCLADLWKLMFLPEVNCTDVCVETILLTLSNVGRR